MTKTKPLLLILAGIGVLAFALATFQLTRPQKQQAPRTTQQQNSTTEQPIKPSASTQPAEQQSEPETINPDIDTTNWKTYRNDEYAYQISYPTNFEVDSSDPQNVFIGSDLIHRGPKGVYIRILNESATKRINDLKAAIAQEQRNGLQTRILQDEVAAVGKNEARKFVTTTAIGYDSLYYFLTINGMSFELKGVNGEQYHEPIIQTFQSLETK